MTAEVLRETGGTKIQAIEKAVAIITMLEDLGAATPTELSHHTGITRSTIHVHLRTLRQYGYVVKESGKYRTGLQFLEHGGKARKQIEVYEDAKLEVDHLARETGELCDLGVEQDGMRVLLYKAETDRAVYDNVITGDITHMHWTALGKSLLAWRPREEIDEIVERRGLPRATEATITEKSALFEELDNTVERGYAIGDEERRRGITSIGVPILDADRVRAIAALSVAGPRRRIRDGNVEWFVEELQNSANVIELRHTHY